MCTATDYSPIHTQTLYCILTSLTLHIGQDQPSGRVRSRVELRGHRLQEAGVAVVAWSQD